MPTTSLESLTLDQLRTCRRLYDEATTDALHVYHLDNAVNILGSLRDFYLAKIKDQLEHGAPSDRDPKPEEKPAPAQ